MFAAASSAAERRRYATARPSWCSHPPSRVVTVLIVPAESLTAVRLQLGHRAITRIGLLLRPDTASGCLIAALRVEDPAAEVLGPSDDGESGHPLVPPGQLCLIVHCGGRRLVVSSVLAQLMRSTVSGRASRERHADAQDRPEDSQRQTPGSASQDEVEPPQQAYEQVPARQPPLAAGSPTGPGHRRRRGSATISAWHGSGLPSPALRRTPPPRDPAGDRYRHAVEVAPEAPRFTPTGG